MSLPKEFDTTPPSLWEQPISRKAFLLASSSLALLLANCGNSPSYSPEGIRRGVGEWSPQDIIGLSNAMMAEKDFDSITYAGYLLQQETYGLPAFHQLDPVFINSCQRIKLDTVKKFMLKDPVTDKTRRVPMASEITTAGSITSTTLRYRDSSQTVPTNSYNQLSFNEVRIDQGLLEGRSDFLFKFIMAKELLNTQAISLLLDYLTMNVDLPKNSDEANAIKVKLFTQGTIISPDNRPTHITPNYVIDYWAHFLMVPNYLDALGKNKFSLKDREDNMLKVMDYSAQTFLKDNLLTTAPDGKYQWRQDTTEAYNSWMELTERYYLEETSDK